MTTLAYQICVRVENTNGPETDYDIVKCEDCLADVWIESAALLLVLDLGNSIICTQCAEKLRVANPT